MASTLADYKKRMAWMHELLGSQCVECGATEKLHIHHTERSAKKFTISERWAAAKEILLLELKKCELRCTACHKKVHTKPHGTEARYRHSACRCDLCKAAHVKAHAEYRVRRRTRDPNFRKSTRV